MLVLAGQSNWGNLGGQRVASHHPDQVVSYFNGRCGPAQSPLLGTSEGRGNSGPLLADRLIDSGQFDSVVLVPAAISASTIDRWRQGGDLNPLLVQAVRDVKSRYKITHVLWHQGESDYRRTKQEDYARGFASVVTSLRAEGVEAPILAAVTTKCLYTVDFDPNDPVALAQRALPDPSQKIFAGPDTDALVLDEDRYDGCHFGASGMEKFANAWAEAIAAVK